jgi:signal transduction histidine kinase
VPTLSEPFRRISKQPDGGVGLGLSIAQSVSIAHGAQLEISRQPEGGLDISLILRSRPW